MAEVWAHSAQKGSSLLVLLAIADNASDEGVAWPSAETIAAKARMSKRQVLRIVHQIADDGELRIETRRDGRSAKNVYTVVSRGQVVTMNGSFMVTNPTIHGDTAMSPEPSVEPSVVQERATATPLAPAKKRKPREPDPLWDVLVEIFGAEAAGMERGRWNVACKSLRESGATADTLRAAAATYRGHETFGRVMMTPTALAANWTILTANGTNGHHAETPEAFRARIAAIDQRWKEQPHG